MRNRIDAMTVLAVAIGLASAAALDAADDDAPRRATFYEDVLPIMQENCQVCHRAGGETIAGMIAPMSLVTYPEVRPWAKAIARQVQARQMPPWDATGVTAGHFLNERVLTEAEIATLVRWVSGGAPMGRPDKAPEPKVFDDNGGWVIGRPDLIVPIPEPYFIADDVEDIQPSFMFEITKEQLPEPRWLQAIEYKPDSEVVHHITGRAIVPASEGLEEETFSLGSIAAGEDPTIYPEGFGNLLRPGTIIRVSMHYHKEVGPGTGVWDRSLIGFKFHPKGTQIKHKVNWSPISNHSFEIPPGHPNWIVGSSRTFEKDTILLSIHPHMHFRGKSMKYTAYYPNGASEVLLDVDRYEYAWQTNYIYEKPRLLPAGTRIDVDAVFDNSPTIQAKVPYLNIARPVSYGAPTTDEMMNPFLAWTYVEPEEAEAFRSSGRVMVASSPE